MDNNSKFSVWTSFYHKYRRYFQVGIIGLVLVIMVAIVLNSHEDPLSGAYRDYEKQTDNDEMSKLINNYYKYYADGDVDSLKKIATPVTDKEASYIAFMSEYVESYTVEEIYSKEGTEKGSFLVSVDNEAKYKDLKKKAPGLDFFYVETNKKGKLYINNRYSTFNTNEGELEVDETVTSLIAAFEQQEDVNELRQQVQADFNQLTLDDADFNEYFTATLPDAIASWAADYQKQEEEAAAKKSEEEAKSSEEAAKSSEEEAKKSSEEEAKKSEEEAKSSEEEAKKKEEEKKKDEETETTMVYVLEKVNVRSEPSETSESLGLVDPGSALTKFSEADGWTKVDLNGKTGYIKSEYVSAEKPDTSAADAAGLTLGSTVRLSESTNIRTEASESADRLALAYAGESVTVISVDANGWTKVNYNGQEGYIKTEYVR